MTGPLKRFTLCSNRTSSSMTVLFVLGLLKNCSILRSTYVPTRMENPVNFMMFVFHSRREIWLLPLCLFSEHPQEEIPKNCGQTLCLRIGRSHKIQQFWRKAYRLPNVTMRNTLTSTEREDARSTELMFVTVSFTSAMGLPSPTLSPRLTFDGWQRASESFRCPSVLSAICTMYQNFSLCIVVFIFGCVAKVDLKPYSTIRALKELSYSRGFDELLI